MLVRNWLLSPFPPAFTHHNTSWSKFQSAAYPYLSSCPIDSPMATSPVHRLSESTEATQTLSPKSPPRRTRYVSIPARKLLSKSDAPRPPLLTQRQTKTSLSSSCLFCFGRTVAAGQRTVSNNAGIASIPQPPDLYCHRAPQTST